MTSSNSVLLSIIKVNRIIITIFHINSKVFQHECLLRSIIVIFVVIVVPAVVAIRVVRTVRRFIIFNDVFSSSKASRIADRITRKIK